jgi:hypothetical protein
MYLKNRSPTKFLEHITPYEEFYGYKPIVNHLRIFWCKAFSHIPKEDKKNLMQSRPNVSSLVIVLTINLTKCMIPLLINVFASRDVIFHEYANEVQKEDDQDVWKLPKEGIESAKVEEIEDQQDDVEDKNGKIKCIEATSNQSTPRKSGATPQAVRHYEDQQGKFRHL